MAIKKYAPTGNHNQVHKLLFTFMHEKKKSQLIVYHSGNVTGRAAMEIDFKYLLIDTEDSINKKYVIVNDHERFSYKTLEGLLFFDSDGEKVYITCDQLDHFLIGIEIVGYSERGRET